MKSYIYKIFLLIAILFCSVSIRAYNVYLLTAQELNGIVGNYSVPSPHPMTEISTNVFIYDIDVSRISGAFVDGGEYVYFRIGVQGWSNDMQSYQNGYDLGIYGEEYIISSACYGHDKTWRIKKDTRFETYTVEVGIDVDGKRYVKVTAKKPISLRDYNDVKYTKSDNMVETRNITGRGGYNYFCTWSDQTAWVKPDNIDMFVVSGYTGPVENGGNVTPATITLNKLSTDYIPAGVGLILAAKTKSSSGTTSNRGDNGTSFNQLHEQLRVCQTENATYSGNSLLTPCYEETALPRTQTIDGTEYANYLFGFYRSKKAGFSNAADNDFTLGFWVSNGSGNTYANSAYFRIKLDEAELIGVGTSYDLSAMANAKPCFLLDFPEDETVATGISDASHLNDHEQMINDKGGWYTLDGRRLDGQPTAKGIYICNGKKFIMK